MNCGQLCLNIGESATYRLHVVAGTLKRSMLTKQRIEKSDPTLLLKDNQ